MKQSSSSIDVIKLCAQKVTVPSGLEDLVDGYAKNILIDLIALEKSFLNQEIDNSGKIIHKLKGTAQSYGFDVVDSILNIMQSTMHDRNSEEMSVLSSHLIKYVEDFLCDQKI